MCMTFGCNPQINFCYFFCSSNLVIFDLDTEHLVNPTTGLAGPFLTFACVFQG